MRTGIVNKRKAKRDTTAEVITGPAGKQIVRVPLAHAGEHALIDYDDYVALIKSGVSLAWYSSAGNTRRYVCVKRDRRVVAVARLIVGASKGRCVRYRDGDPLNLQSANLSPASDPCADCPDPRHPASSQTRAVV